MKLYVVRHGQTDLNIQRRMQGRRGLPLNAEGRAQAAAAREELKDVKFDLAFSSPQERAVETAEIIAPGVDIITDERIDVFDVGEADGVLIDDKSVSLYGIVPDRDKFGGVEELESFGARVTAFMDELLSRFGNSDKTLLIAGHKCTTGMIECYFNGLPGDGNFFSRSSKNGRYKIYTIENGKYRTVDNA